MRILLSAIAVFIGFAIIPAKAQKTAPDRCLALAWDWPKPAQRSIIHRAALKPYQVRVTYNGHSTFTIESPKGVTAATDYNDYIRPVNVPTIVTMNVAHDTHYSASPDPRVKHVLRGWNPNGDAAAIHDLTVQDMRVRNVPTNIRSGYGGPTSGRYGNSIFVFEVGGLCIAHLGHLHHTLTTQQLAQIGQMDVVFVPIDGSWTLDTAGTFEVLKSLNAPIVIPMHWFSLYSLEEFLNAAKPNYEVVRSEASVVISKDRLPSKKQILAMPPSRSFSYE